MMAFVTDNGRMHAPRRGRATPPRMAFRPSSIMAALASTFITLATAVALALALAGCSSPGHETHGGQGQGDENDNGSATTQEFTPSSGEPKATLSIASGSENKEVATAIQQAVDDSGVAVTLHYMGSLDIMDALEQGGEHYDAVWPASSMWISMGDTRHLVKDARSTSTTPIVFGIAASKAQELGWASADGTTVPVSTADIIDAVSSGDLAFSMTSATQSNSGASAYLAFLTALRGGDGPLTSDDLDDDDLRERISTLLSGVDRSSGSSDWLKEMVVADPDRFDAMVNYESLVIQADKELTDDGHEPLLAVYPADGIAVSDSPLGYIDRGQDLEDAFADFQQALSSKDAMLEFERAGRRTGLGGTLAYPDDEQVARSFRPEWGVNTDASALRTIPLPAASVIEQALDVYQSELRKPSWTVWVVDYSGSMYGAGKDGVVDGLTSALGPAASTYHIEPTTDDVNVFIPFSSSAGEPIVARGSDTADLLDAVNDHRADGGTDIYAGLDAALGQLPDDPGDYTTAIVLMTDGRSDTSGHDGFVDDYRSDGHGLPIFSIMFGDADSSQLDDLAQLSNAKVFDGRDGDLGAVFRQVKGFN